MDKSLIYAHLWLIPTILKDAKLEICRIPRPNIAYYLSKGNQTIV
jgi:hypothetical protein